MPSNLHTKSRLADSESALHEVNRSMATDGSTAQLRGMHEGANVTVDITRSGDNTSRIVVTAREGELGYRPSQAGRILQQILDRV